MARPRVLTPEIIIDAAAAIVREVGADRLTIRALGSRLGVDPTSIYRYFATMNDVRRALGDHLLGDVDVTVDERETWRHAVHSICTGIRRAQLRQPNLAVLVRGAPTRLSNELRITEAVLAQLGRAGLHPADAATAYHALIELSVGSAAIDVELDAEPTGDREQVYASWRADYAALDSVRFPASVQAAAFLYDGTADQRFDQAITLLLDGIAAAATHAAGRVEPVSDPSASR